MLKLPVNPAHRRKQAKKNLMRISYALNISALVILLLPWSFGLTGKTAVEYVLPLVAIFQLLASMYLDRMVGILDRTEGET